MLKSITFDFDFVRSMASRLLECKWSAFMTRMEYPDLIAIGIEDSSYLMYCASFVLILLGAVLIRIVVRGVIMMIKGGERNLAVLYSIRHRVQVQKVLKVILVGYYPFWLLLSFVAVQNLDLINESTNFGVSGALNFGDQITTIFGACMSLLTMIIPFYVISTLLQARISRPSMTAHKN